MTEKATAQELVDLLNKRLCLTCGGAYPGVITLAQGEALSLVRALCKTQQQIKGLEKDLEFSRAGYDTLDCTPKEAQPDEKDPNTVSG